MSLQAQWWLNAPNVNGWPTYLTTAKLYRNYSSFPFAGAVPGSVASMAIEAYLKYYAYTGDTAYLNMVGTIGDYIVQRGLTPATYAAYPRFPWPAGGTGNVNPDGCCHPGNVPGNIMPDKGAMIGIALLHLYEATNNITYRDAAIQIANALANNVVPGTATQSPWPFRANANTGAFVDGRLSGNQVFALRLFDELIRLGIAGNGKYQTTRDIVWAWLKNVAIADTTGDKWMHFFEDHSGTENNPTQFDALETARYLLEQKDALDPNWFAMAGSLIDLVKRRWVVFSGQYTAIGEQQFDMTAYNSHAARYASILAMYFEAGGPAAYKVEAYSSFAFSTYSVDFDGFADTYFGEHISWTTDSFGDWMQHFMNGLGAVPQWAPGNSDHLLRSSSVVQSITYRPDEVSYNTFDAAGREKLKLTFTPASVLVDGSPSTSWNWDSLTHVLVVDRANGTAVDISADASPGFSVAVTGGQSTVVGSSATFTASITAAGGFTGTVGLVVTGLPHGATADFTPAAITTSGSSTLNVATSPTTPPGFYTLIVTGTSGSLSRTASTTLEIIDEGVLPDFALSVTPGSQSAIAGANTTYSANVTAAGGFGGIVNLSVSGLPAGATAGFTPAAVTGSGSSTLNLATVSTTPAGSYTLTVTGTSGSLSDTTNITLTVTSPSTTITFDDLSPVHRVLNGQYPTGVINWGTGTSWYLSGPWGSFTTQSLSFTSSTQTSATFAFMAGSGLAGLHAYNGGSGSSTVTISCAGQPSVQTSVAAGTMKTINTGWAAPCSPVTLASTNGWDTNFDNLTTLPSGPDFAVSATPGSQTVVPGNSTSYTVSITALSGFNHAVNFSVTGLPAGVAGTFSSDWVTGSGSSDLTVTTSPTSPVGSYPLTITGTGPSRSHTASVTLVINTSPDFSFSATPVSRAVVQGNSTTYTVSTTALNGFNGVIGFSQTGLPAGATAAFSPASVTGSGSSTLNVTTSSTATVGSFELTITGTSGALVHSASVTLVVNADPLDTIPPGRSDGQPSGTLAVGTTSATLQLTTDEPATCRYSTIANTGYAAMSNVFSTTGATAQSTVVAGLVNGQTYTYFVRCADGAGNANADDFAIGFTVAFPTGLVAAFGFNEASGTTAQDISGRGNNGNLVNATRTATGRYGRGLLFNGTNAWVSVADSASLDLTNGMTLEAWVQPNAAMNTSWRSVMVKQRSGGLSYSLYASTNAGLPGSYINLGGTDRNVQGPSAVPVNSWTHIAATFNGTTLRLYVNGLLVRSTAMSGALVTTTGALGIGGNSVWGEWFAGYIDEVRIYNRALTAGEITSDMNTAIP